jgi:hypothetical protein
MISVNQVDQATLRRLPRVPENKGPPMLADIMGWQRKIRCGQGTPLQSDMEDIISER